MGLQYKVKAGSITNLTDARYFSALGTDWLGFNLDVLQKNSVSLKDAKTIKEWLFEPKIVVEAGHHQDKTELIYLANELNAEAVQIDCEHDLLKADHFAYPIILETSFAHLKHIKLKRALDSDLSIEVILIKVDPEKFIWEDFNKGIKFKRESIEKLQRDFTVLIDLPFQSEWFLEAMELLQVDGIHISTEQEEEVGLSKVDEYDDILSLIEVDEDDLY